MQLKRNLLSVALASATMLVAAGAQAQVATQSPQGEPSRTDETKTLDSVVVTGIRAGIETSIDTKKESTSIVEAISAHKPPQGWASLMVAVLVLAGVQLIVVGLIGEYLGRMFLAVNRKPHDAKISYSANGIGEVQSKKGLAVRAQALEDQIDQAVARPGAERRFVAQTKKIAPKVTTKELAKKYPAIIVIDRATFRLRLFKHLKLAKTYGIAVGQQGLETPAGLYDIQDKQVNPSWHVPNSPWAGKLAGTVIPPGPADPIKARWMGVNGGAGIHGTDVDGSIGTAASHGCIRMHIPDVIELYDQVGVGDPVYIA